MKWVESKIHMHSCSCNKQERNFNLSISRHVSILNFSRICDANKQTFYLFVNRAKVQIFEIQFKFWIVKFLNCNIGSWHRFGIIFLEFILIAFLSFIDKKLEKLDKFQNDISNLNSPVKIEMYNLSTIFFVFFIHITT